MMQCNSLDLNNLKRQVLERFDYNKPISFIINNFLLKYSNTENKNIFLFIIKPENIYMDDCVLTFLEGYASEWELVVISTWRNTVFLLFAYL